MRSSCIRGRAALLALLLVLGLAACGEREVSDIPPLSAASGGQDLGLGPGVQALSSGPGEKGSPSWSPSGERVAYTVDGYVVDEPVGEGKPRRLTTRDFGAEWVTWVSERDLAVLGRTLGEGGGSGPRFFYQTAGRPATGSFLVEKISENALAAAPGPEGSGSLVALQTEGSESALALIGEDGEARRIYTRRLEGRITGLSLSPDGEEAVVSLLEEDGSPASYSLHLFDLGTGAFEGLVRLREGVEVFGSPQWTDAGIYYAAGEEGGEAVYGLYRARRGSEEPERGAGEEFSAFGLRASPDGDHLAVIGRRTNVSPTNLYLMDPESGELTALTSNEDMEIKTGPDDLAWSRDGRKIALVARGVLPGVRVYSAQAGDLLADFYNLYEVEVRP